MRPGPQIKDMTPKRLLLTLLLLCACLPGRAKKIIFTPQYYPQSQFAGFYIAKEKGFYEEEGLDVVIRHIGVTSNETAHSLLVDGKIHIGGVQLFQALKGRAAGEPLVNIFQITQNIGLCCVSKKPLKSFEDLDGLKVSTWSRGYSDICEMLEKAEGIKIRWIKAFNPVNLLIFDAVDAVLAYSYSEMLQLWQSMGRIPEENILHFSDVRLLNMPEDGLYVTESYYARNRETIEKFIRATVRGWEYARKNIDEAVDISFKYIRESHIVTNRQKQKAMLEEYLKLQVNPKTGRADFPGISPEDLDRIQDLMINSGVISKRIEHKDFTR